MNQPVSQRASGLPAAEHLAPDFRVEVEGRELEPLITGDIREVRVVSELNNISHFELLLDNWSESGFQLKNGDSETFAVGNRVRLSMGYKGHNVSLITGRISSLTAYFPEDGDPMLRISGLDDLWQLRDRKPQVGDLKQFAEMADHEVVRIVASRNGINRTDIHPEGVTHPVSIQKNQEDASFLLERAYRRDSDLYVRNDPQSGESTLCFKPPTDSRDATAIRSFVFKWGKDLVEFKSRLTVAKQVGKLTVRGWNPQKKEVISYTATTSDLPAGTGNSGPSFVEDIFGNKEDIKVDYPVVSEEEAKDLAVALLRRRAYEFISSTGRVIGFPELRAGDNVEIDGVGERFGGLYYLQKVEHNIGDNGFATLFEGRRVYDGGGKADAS